MNWPEKPLCHGEDIFPSGIFKVGDVEWRPAKPEGNSSDDQNPYGYPFRTCSYCGSIHPEDLIKFLNEGAKLKGSDWKYGWPHKFYVENIPNPLAGKECKVYVSCGILNEADLAEGGWEKHGDVFRQLHSGYKAPPHTHAKWYNDHLGDLDDDAFQLLSEALAKRAGVTFRRSGGKLSFAAPRAGYQA